MRIHKWQLKYAAVVPFMLTDSSAALYDWLTAKVLGTQVGMSRKWCYWFREHVVLCRRFGRINVAGSRVWLFEPGWSLAPVLLTRIATGCGPIVTEDGSRLADRYITAAIEQVRDSITKMVKIPDFDPSQAADLLHSADGLRSARDVLGLCGARYNVGPKSVESQPDASADICMSMGRLEHFSEERLTQLIAQMRRILRPNGLGSHIVDHRDHFWYFDKSIHCFNHLTFSDKQWQAVARRKLYRNRLLEPDYISLFKEGGFDVLAAVHELHCDDGSMVNPAELWGRFKTVLPNTLRAAVTHFIVRRR
jgi:SAM-dependent methyltransferase